MDNTGEVKYGLKDRLPRFERRISFSLSSDKEAKEEGLSTTHHVTMVIEEGWTVEDLVDRLLCVTTSPRVALQNSRRGKDVPSSYVVPKMGARAPQGITPFEALTSLCSGDKEAAYEFVKRFGTIEAAIKAVREFMGI